MSGTDVHRSVSVPHQTRLCHVQWNLRRATTSQQSAAAGLDSSQAQTGSASHCLRLQQLFTGVSSQDGRNWHSSCHQQHYRVSRTVLTFTSVITLYFKALRDILKPSAQLNTRSSAIAERPRCRLFKLWQNISAKSVHLTLLYVTALTLTNHNFTVLRHHVCT